MEQITKHVEGQSNGQKTRPPHGDLQVATTTYRRALRAPIALDRLLPIRRQRIRLDAHYLSRFVVQTLGATTAMLPLPRRSSPKATITSRGLCGALAQSFLERQRFSNFWRTNSLSISQDMRIEIPAMSHLPTTALRFPSKTLNAKPPLIFGKNGLSSISSVPKLSLLPNSIGTLRAIPHCAQ